MTTTLDIVAGVDLGGTGTRLVLLAADGTIVHNETRPTTSGEAPEAAVRDLAQWVSSAATGFRMRALGIGASGPVDSSGIIQNSATLPAYTGIAITTLLTQLLDIPCVIDNDAVTAALGEHSWGAAKNSRAPLIVTLGTGIGVALLYRGAPVRAADGTHPESGHIPVPGPPAPCYCGLDTCWEQLASRTALDRLTDGRTVQAAAAAAAGDHNAQALFATYGRRIAVGLSTLLTLTHSDLVVLGGSAASYLPHFGPRLRDALACSPGYRQTPPVKQASLNDLSGAVGAATLGWRMTTPHSG